MTFMFKVVHMDVEVWTREADWRWKFNFRAFQSVQMHLRINKDLNCKYVGNEYVSKFLKKKIEYLDRYFSSNLDFQNSLHSNEPQVC